jgi:polar amino acid transport system substrate-binding protein
MKRKLFLLVSVVVSLSMLLSACAAGSGAGGTKVRVATEASYPPFEVIDDTTKQPVGFDIDLMNAIGKKAGFTPEYQNTPFDSVLAGISTCQFDAAISAITITSERAQKMSFSDSYIAAGQIVAVRTDTTDINGPQDLTGKKIGVQASTTGEIEAKKIAGATVKPYDAVDLAFLDLMNKQVDAVIVDNPTTLTYVNKSPDKLKVVGTPFTDEHYGIAICKKNTALLDKINKALAELKADGTIDKLEKQWLTAK